ncbi:class I SAM-dependent methyltransferase [Brachybacterium sp. DNPG3]
MSQPPHDPTRDADERAAAERAADEPALDERVVPQPDQTDRAIIAAAAEEGLGCPCDVVVVDDATGALTAYALETVADHPEAIVLSWTPSRRRAAELTALFADEIARGRLMIPADAQPVPLGAAAFEADAHLVLMRLPKALHTLRDRARALAVGAGMDGRSDLVLIAGGRVKHMTRSQNDALADVFEEVRAARGVGKSRALVGSGVLPALVAAESGDAAASPAVTGPQTGSVRLPVRGRETALPLCRIGGVFGGASADAGSLLLLDALDRALMTGDAGPRGSFDDDPRGADDDRPFSAVDLGCGNGLMVAYLAAALPGASILGSDDDADAVASTAATLAAARRAAGPEAADAARAAGTEVRVTWDDALAAESSGSADLVLLNPPFHDGAGVDATMVQTLLDAAARVLRPGGELWMVHNSHLRYRGEVEHRVGPVRQRARDRRFTVLSAVRR